MATSRISRDDYFLGLAQHASLRGTCARRQVGCILVNARGKVIATGFNGVPRGFNHCIDIPCPGAMCEPGTGLELCEAIHAEQNALLQCTDVWLIHTVYVTCVPCVTCIKLLLNTSASRVVCSNGYPHREASEHLWVSRAGRILEVKAK